MGITTTASSRTPELRPICNPEPKPIDLRLKRALLEFAYAPVIRTVSWPFFDIEIEIGGES